MTAEDYKAEYQRLKKDQGYWGCPPDYKFKLEILNTRRKKYLIIVDYKKYVISKAYYDYLKSL